ncbi:MAG: efflux RND transporter periplasmic adaptor subunit [Chlorobiaceae bacterium]|nr:efflux RND transporter periplasmic adaptor subunit [Chlorobiaceae bacterium]NTW74492.1 efflux RND transporter periplasmic adaptor subunit [Chlorobiaceae bacterium]
MKRPYLIAGLLLTLIAGWYLWPKGSSGDRQGMEMKPEVSVVTMKTEPVVLTRDLPGRTSALRMAEIRPQVSGIVTKRFFVEGSLVKQGQQLYQIDPAPYQAAYASAQANLGKAEATLRSVQARTARYAELVKIGGVSKQEFDDANANLAQAKADVSIARSEVSTAKINLDYTRVMSPIDGRIGPSKVTEGALVNANQTDPLAVVQQLDQLYVDVSQASDELLRWRNRQHGLRNGNSPDTPTSVRLIIDGKPVGEPGMLKFSDVTVNPSTGTVLLRVLFPNPHHDILPGMFVHARLELWNEDQALLVPQKSVIRNADGSVSVWIVGKDGKASMRPIGVTEIVGDKWLVSQGLAAGEKVVYEGVMKIRPGMAVKTVEAPPTPTPVR